MSEMTLQESIRNKLWTERYRPKTVEELVLPKRIKTQLNEYVKNSDIPNLLLYSPGGMGKTSTAYVLMNSIGCEYLEINGSLDTSIEVVRDKIMTFASTVSMISDNPLKVIFVTEADGFSTDAKNALKNIIEKFSANVRIVFDTNYIDKMPQPLRSRCVELDFNFDRKEYADMMKQMMTKCVSILTENSITFDKKDVAELIKTRFPDMRKIITDLQRASLSGEFVKQTDSPEEIYTEMIASIKERNYDTLRNIVKNITDFDSMYLRLYRGVDSTIDRKSLPQFILILADYQHKSMNCVSKEINFLAMCTEVMAKGIEIK